MTKQSTTQEILEGLRKPMWTTTAQPIYTLTKSDWLLLMQILEQDIHHKKVAHTLWMKLSQLPKKALVQLP